MATCAGVQNVSRPIPMCQEISQYRPTLVEVTANTEDQMYQGIEAARTEDSSATATEDGNAMRAVSTIADLTTPRKSTLKTAHLLEPLRGLVGECGELRILCDEPGHARGGLN